MLKLFVDNSRDKKKESMSFRFDKKVASAIKLLSQMQHISATDVVNNGVVHLLKECGDEKSIQEMKKYGDFMESKSKHKEERMYLHALSNLMKDMMHFAMITSDINEGKPDMKVLKKLYNQKKDELEFMPSDIKKLVKPHLKQIKKFLDEKYVIDFVKRKMEQRNLITLEQKDDEIDQITKRLNESIKKVPGDEEI